MIVVTLTKVPQSLRGDLTKWYQEIQTGVYVGNVSAKIRDLLWGRIIENIGTGEATMVYNTNNELGYQIKTTRRQFQVVDFDGIPLMMRLNNSDDARPIMHGFSNAAKFHQAKLAMRKPKVERSARSSASIVSLDLETTGTNYENNQIISIGAVKKGENDQLDTFYRLIKIEGKVSEKITALTGLTTEILHRDGVDLKTAIIELTEFVKSATLVGYNFKFDELFLMYACRKVKLPELNNKTVDLLPVAKKADSFLDNYQLATVLESYGIKNLTPHNALSDAKATLELANELIKKGSLRI
ncbi:type I-E CRISPR-associated endoribonuclease Cas2e [Lactobacillus sp. ESL0681]|uniref:type I-E CRISPR-associated endoribonuclease Cas2e n=1 Tax=Lactobacillus sp. ESL0681 TaxID=2983211 RepID=UPI0023F8ECDF|nr:type I-E CRISPR-associated endoribonuclease Cas2e [Lactobacillus sp. ESL0681]WEV39903.1 type I-E CRISPR-associated endoribonuclease Cas2e [Lactobacillus sp. ESL0681]